MATRVALATASSLPRSSLPSLAAKLAPHRGLTSGGDHHGPPKVNIWEDPLSPSKWKEEHEKRNKECKLSSCILPVDSITTSIKIFSLQLLMCIRCS
uniref:Uncharacterized protein LOC105052701 isoform X2 n=1 Tax=Elaeis guineensis var. tenera TaxID=51953 RepID=A0A6I9RSS6_ELAGV|nr:uncharacterized protein LOC105052701 isoform X2 [Elaeis guineensis]